MNDPGKTKTNIYLVNIGITATQILGPNANRVGIMFITNNNFANSTYFAQDAGVTTSTGQIFGSTPGVAETSPIEVWRYRMGDAICDPWFAVATVATTRLIWEIEKLAY